MFLEKFEDISPSIAHASADLDEGATSAGGALAFHRSQ
jgi:hypothetical protein